MTKEELTLSPSVIKPTSYRGNSASRREYLDYLAKNNIKLTDWQLEACVGLVLSHATIQLGSCSSLKGEEGLVQCRLKIQQSLEHYLFLEHVFQLLEEYSGSDKSINVVKTRVGMFNFQTMTISQFNIVGNLFAKEPFVAGSTYTKIITEQQR